MTPQDVTGATFRETRFRSGYDQADVEAFLDQVAAAMRSGHSIDALMTQLSFTRTRFRPGYQRGDVDMFLESLRGWAPPQPPAEPARSRLTAQDIRAVSFRATKLQPGYAQPEVDDFLDEVAKAVQVGDDVRGRVRSVAFTEVRWQEGYNPTDVDAFLDQLAE